MIKGFREFILRGNVIDLAVAVVIGAAFTTVVTALVDSLINPIIGAVFDADSLANAFPIAIPTVSGGTAVIGIGAILSAVLNFLIIALVVYFVFVLPVNKMRERRERIAKENGEVEDAEPTETDLLAEIRDLLAKRSGD